MVRIFCAVFILFLIAGCAKPASYTDIPLTSYDHNTRYGIEDREDGFTIEVLYARYQFIPESDALAAACKSQLTAIAWDVAEQKGREIEPINEQRIRMSMGRNGLSGMTSCRASAVVKYKEAQ